MSLIEANVPSEQVAGFVAYYELDLVVFLFK